MSRNFTADVDTQREYFNATYFNNSGSTQVARYDTSLLKPFFPNPDKWKLSINRMRIPLSGIPLTKNNIPFATWKVGLSYKTSSTMIPDDFQANVPQLNEKYETHPLNYNMVFTNVLSEVIKHQTKYNDLSVWNAQTQISTKAIVTGGSTQYDIKTGTNGTIYLLDDDTNTLTMCQATSMATITSITFPSDTINNFCVDVNSGDLYLQTSGLTNQYTFRKYTRTNNTTWTASNTWQYTDPTQYFPYITICNGNLIGGDNASSLVAVFNLTSFTLSFQTTISNLGSIYCYGTSNIYIQINGTAGTSVYNIVGSSLVNIGGMTTAIDHFPLGLDYNGNLILNNTNATNPTFYAYPATGGALVYSFQKSINAFPLMILPSTGTASEAVEAGAADIFTYQTYLNQINAAFLKAFNTAKTDLGASFIPTQPPEIIYNAQSKLFSLIVEGQYLTTNADGSNQYAVYMNDALWQQFYFPSNVYSTGFKSIMIQNYGINAVVGTGSASLPQFIYVQQEDSTIYSFYDLVRIIVGTTRIPVSGDGEGKTFSNTSSVSNNSINMITDIVPDTTTLTPGSVLIYVPAGILRWYNLYAQQPFDKIDLFLQYETKDGSIYPIDIVNGEFFSVKLEFKQGPGDF